MRHKIRWMLVLYDTLIYLLFAYIILVLYPGFSDHLQLGDVLACGLISYAGIFIIRAFMHVYKTIWRYAGPDDYIRMIVGDGLACAAFLLVRHLFPHSITFVRCISLYALVLLGSISIRMAYQWVYQRRSKHTRLDRFARSLLGATTGVIFSEDQDLPRMNRIRVAIIGAGSIGAILADELLQNTRQVYQPICFVDIDEGKVGREISGLPVLEAKVDLHSYGVQEVIFALPSAEGEKRERLYHIYKDMGYKIKIYDFLNYETGNTSGKRQLHDFNIEDLLFRPTNQVLDEKTKAWYRGKSVLITGGGGSIGSELARQIAQCEPSRLVILDVYENGAYDVQQELRIRYGDALNMRIEIASVCDREKIEKIFAAHTPDIVLHAAAHKHVPLMERNVCEAVSNNVFGTLNVVNACEKYGVGRFIMVSTDKAVNPTNVMGATKRMCEMIVQSRTGGKTCFSATRFGNVLGSNGSVIPLFKKQIANGGPVTLTDKRIIRYFMTIPEASQLVMTSGAMAKNGELYVLDMGKPVKILDLAENMIRLSGLEPYQDIDIVEMGLRPGEKLYEELLIKSEELDTTENKRIYVERDRPLAPEEIDAKLRILSEALKTQSNHVVKKALMEVVPTYHSPEEVNEKAINAEEMRVVAGA